MNKNSILNTNKGSNTLELEGNLFSLDELVQKILMYKSKDTVALFQAINLDYIFTLLDKEKLEEIELSFQKEAIVNIDVLSFVQTFLSHINHNEDQTIYLTISLIEFFKRISESQKMSPSIKFQDITSTVCKYIEKNFQGDYQILTRSKPPKRYFTEALDPSKNSLNFESPLVYENDKHSCLRRIYKGKFKTDSSFHNGHKIKNAAFAKGIKRVITLDSLDKKIQLYDLNCQLVKSIEAKSMEDDEKLGVIIFGVAWSEKQQRIGAVLKNFTMSFWDAANDFKFEKNFQVHGYAPDFQTSIWFLEKHNMWITTCSSNCLYSWDIAQEITLFSLSSASIKGVVFSIVELTDLDIVAVGTADKKVSIWNFFTQTLLFQIESPNIELHSIAFSNAFQILITAGYENNISLYSINKEELDATLVGQLEGHSSMVSCIQVIEGTPMVISVDDFGKIRLWDIRNQNCIQIYDCSSSQTTSGQFAKKIHIHLVLDLFCEGMIALLGNRLNLVNFDEREDIIKQHTTLQNQFPLKVEINSEKEELVTCTSKELKFYDLKTGRCKVTINGMMENEQDDITTFKQVDQGQLFLLGNQKGDINLHSFNEKGKAIKKLISHSSDVVQLKIDYSNKLLISGGCDSSIKIQKLSQDFIELKRTISNAHYGKAITMLEVSVYHNVIFSASQDCRKVLVFDYEYGKLLNYIEFKQKVGPTAICALSGYPILIVATSDNLIYITCFHKKENQISFDLLGIINLESDETINNHFKKSFFTSQQSEELKNIKRKSTIDMTQPILKANQSLFSSISYQKTLRIEECQNNLEISRDEEELEEEKLSANLITKFLPDFSFNLQNKLEKSFLFCATNKGNILKFNLAYIFSFHSKIQFVQNACTRLNYNAQRNSTEDFMQAIKKFSQVGVKYSQSSQPTTKFSEQNKLIDFSLLKNLMLMENIKAHKDQINSIIFLNNQNHHIITSSFDQYIKIWDKQNMEQICSLNINHPLPVQWQYINCQTDKATQLVTYALRVLDLIDR